MLFIPKGTGYKVMFVDLGLTPLGLGLIVYWRLCESQYCSLQPFLGGSLFHE